MPNVEIISVGTELLLGDLVDTNSAFIARRLAETGIDVYAMRTVGDNQMRIAAEIRASLERADGAIVTGGLGPTVDDVTREAVCAALSLESERHEPSVARMREVFARFGRPMRENNLKQADLPRGAEVLANDHGTAPGFIVDAAPGRFVACVPGVPYEMKAVLDEKLLPKLRQRLQVRERIVTRVLSVTGLGESEVDHRIDDIFRAGENPKVAVLAHLGSCDVKIMAKARDEAEARAMIDPIEKEVRERLHDHVFGTDGETLAKAALKRLGERGWRLALAESCTGGRVAAAITSVPGASQRFAGGVVAYEDAAKTQLLGVDEGMIARRGAVSEETAMAMADGAARRLGAEVAVATTGIAGPGGATAGKPIGMVCLAIATPDVRRALTISLPGDRDAVQARATQSALALLWSGLDEQRKGEGGPS